MTADETPAQPDMGHASPSDLASVARASNASAVTELIPAAQPDFAPAPDGNAGGVDVEAIAERRTAHVRSHDHPGAFACCTAHASADDVPALLTGVERLRHQLRSADARINWLGAQREELATKLAEAIRERDKARAKTDGGRPLGYVVFMREHGRWSENWDGEVHVTRDEGLAASADARAAGYEAVLTAAIAVEPVTDDGGAG